jgi:hypothetical protein
VGDTTPAHSAEDHTLAAEVVVEEVEEEEAEVVVDNWEEGLGR